MKHDKFGPSRGELWFRLLASIAGLALMVAAIGYRGVTGTAWAEIVGFAGAFFGGTAVWAAWKLHTGRRR